MERRKEQAPKHDGQAAEPSEQPMFDKVDSRFQALQIGSHGGDIGLQLSAQL
jgi:hypothetical protein